MPERDAMRTMMTTTKLWPALAFVAAAAAGCGPGNPAGTALTGDTTITHAAPLDTAMAARFAELALACVHRPYPNKIAHVLESDSDARPPRELTPAFYGCYDWHSAVHGHWLLARLARLFPTAGFAAPARAALAESLTPDNIAQEVAYIGAASRTSFERPYGLAWLLQLSAELQEWSARDSSAGVWLATLMPLESLAADRIRTWLPDLSHPIRIGEHFQTAFAFGLIWDWAQLRADSATRSLLRERILTYYGADVNCPMAYEPSGQDFLSPCLAEADLVRRVLEPDRFRDWLGTFLPTLPVQPDPAWLAPAVVTNPTDGKLGHLIGLNLSRAWMLEGIAGALPTDDPRRAPVLRSAAAHEAAGLAGVSPDIYEGSHWLGSFATYLLTGRGLTGQSPR
jgi:hypothetical protein